MGSGVIVVGTDFSESSAAAYLEARQLARKLNASMDLVHVSEESGWRDLPAVVRWLNKLDLDLAAVTVLAGTPWIELIRYAEDTTAVLICVGSHGNAGFQPLMPGTTTLRLLTRSSIPVLVVRPDRPSFLAADALHGRPSTPLNPEPRVKT